MLFRAFAGLLLVLASCTCCIYADEPIPGALLAGGNFPNDVRQYSFSGSLLDTVTISGMAGNLTGLTYSSGSVWAIHNATNGPIGTINMTTGVFTQAFLSGLGSPEGLGNIGTDLLAVDSNGTVRRFTSTGILVSSFFAGLSFFPTGIDSDGTDLFITNFNNGRVYRYSATGTQLNSFDTGLGQFRLSSVGYDAQTDSLWIGATFFDAREVRNYTKDGTLISSFGGFNEYGTNGLEVVSAAVPEPAVTSLVGLGLTGIAAAWWLRRKQQQHTSNEVIA